MFAFIVENPKLIMVILLIAAVIGLSSFGNSLTSVKISIDPKSKSHFLFFLIFKSDTRSRLNSITFSARASNG